MTGHILRMRFTNCNSREANIFIYHDNGQVGLTKILVSVFNMLYAHVEFRKVKPVEGELLPLYPEPYHNGYG